MGGGLPAGLTKVTTAYERGTNDAIITFPIDTTKLTPPFIISITRNSDDISQYGNVLKSFSFSCLQGDYMPTNTIIQYVAQVERGNSLTLYTVQQLRTNYQGKIWLTIANGVFDEKEYACTVYSKG